MVLRQFEGCNTDAPSCSFATDRYRNIGSPTPVSTSNLPIPMTIAPPSIVETITAMNFPMLYLAKPIKAQELISKVETVEEVYTNAFDARLVEWGETGVSPYLHNTDADYVFANVDFITEGDWTFPSSAGSGTITSVKLRFEARVSVANCGDVEVYVWNGTSWVNAGIFSPTTTYAWYKLDVSAILNTWAKINGAQVYLLYYQDLAGTCYVRRLTRKVDYTGLTIIRVAKDFPEELIKSGKAKELKSKWS